MYIGNFVNEQIVKNNTNLGKSLERLSTGLKINKASDNASGLAISDKLRTQASGLSQGVSNINSAIAFTQIADGAMREMSNILDIIKQKAIQMKTATTTNDGKIANRKEIIALIENFDKIICTTNYNEIYPLRPNENQFTFQIADTKNDTIGTEIEDILSSYVGNGYPSNLYNFVYGFDKLDINFDQKIDTKQNDGQETFAFGIPDNTDQTTIDLSTFTSTDILYIRDHATGDEIAKVIGGNLTVTNGSTINFDLTNDVLTLNAINTNFEYNLDINIVPDDSKRVHVESQYKQLDSNADWAKYDQGNGVYEIDEYINLSSSTRQLFSTLPGEVDNIEFDFNGFGAVGEKLTINNKHNPSQNIATLNGTGYTTAPDKDEDGIADGSSSDNVGIKDTSFFSSWSNDLDASGNGTVTLEGIGDDTIIYATGLALGTNKITITLDDPGMKINDLQLKADIHFSNEPTKCPVYYEYSEKGLDLEYESGILLSVADNSLTQLNHARSEFGSTQIQLESASRNIMTQITNIKSAESIIRDVDYAEESAAFKKSNIISQAGTFALSQVNEHIGDTVKNVLLKI